MMKSETAKLPKGQSYPLRPSVLEAALSGAGVGIDTHLIRSPGRLFDAHFWPPNENLPYERLYVRAGSVPAEEATNARKRMEEVAVPALVAWIAKISSLDSKSPVRREKQFFNLGIG